MNYKSNAVVIKHVGNTKRTSLMGLLGMCAVGALFAAVVFYSL